MSFAPEGRSEGSQGQACAAPGRAITYLPRPLLGPVDSPGLPRSQVPPPHLPGSPRPREGAGLYACATRGGASLPLATFRAPLRGGPTPRRLAVPTFRRVTPVAALDFGPATRGRTPSRGRA